VAASTRTRIGKCPPERTGGAVNDLAGAVEHTPCLPVFRPFRDESNTFAPEPVPGFHEKDKVENYPRRQVCSGTMSLTDVPRHARATRRPLGS
jgi:hypothetical protein